MIRVQGKQTKLWELSSVELRSPELRYMAHPPHHCSETIYFFSFVVRDQGACQYETKDRSY
jgi:hypothetical protein